MLLNTYCYVIVTNVGGADVTVVNGKGETAADIAVKRARDWVLGPILEKGSALNLMVHR